jgi:hypothetical protein
MSSVSQVTEALQQVLTRQAKEIERETGFVERSTAQLDGPLFAQTTVLGWMDDPQASSSQFQHVASSLGVQVSNQAIEQRFGKASARLMQGLLEEAVGQVISSEASAPELLGRFNGVYLQDGTIISLPAALAPQWPGCGGNTPEAGQSSLRAQVRLELSQGQMQGPWLQAGREAERGGAAMEAPLPLGCLFNVDMGYFTLAEMGRHGKEGHGWLTQAKANLKLSDQRGQCWDLLEAHHSDTVDLHVFEVRNGAVTSASDRGATLPRAGEGASQASQHPTRLCAQRLSTTGETSWGQSRQAPALAQESAGESSTGAAAGMDGAADQCAAGATQCGRSVGAGTLSLADRTAVEAVETVWQTGYLAQYETVPGADRDGRQAAGPAHHALADDRGVLAGA